MTIPLPELISTSSSFASLGAHVAKKYAALLDACFPSGQSNSGNGIRRISYFTLLLLGFTTSSYAFEEAKCVPLTQKICLDDSERIIEGYRVKQCWQYKQIHKCSGKEANHCADFEDNRGCNEIAGKCLAESQTGLCNHFEKKFICGQTLNQNQEIKLVDSLFTVLRDEQDLEQCDPQIKNNFCEITSEECIEPAETRNINGKDVHKDCWKWDRKYQCRTGTAVDDCKQYEEKGCKQISKECIHTESDRCEHYVIKYECDEKKTEHIDCIASQFCVGDNCDSQIRNVNTNFGLAASYLGVMAQMGKDQQGCTCNQETDPTCIQSSIDETKCQMFSGSAHICRRYTGEFNCCAGRGFLRKIAACSEEEKDLAIKREAKVCHFVGSWKGSGLTGKFKKKSSYCCFNSPLARVIQEQARQQLGKGWGNHESHDCSPLTLEEIKRIDFTKMDFSELYHDLQNQASGNLNSQKNKINEELKSYQQNPNDLADAIRGKMESFYAK